MVQNSGCSALLECPPATSTSAVRHACTTCLGWRSLGRQLWHGDECGGGSSVNSWDQHLWKGRLGKGSGMGERGRIGRGRRWDRSTVLCMVLKLGGPSGWSWVGWGVWAAVSPRHPGVGVAVSEVAPSTGTTLVESWVCAESILSHWGSEFSVTRGGLGDTSHHPT